MKVTRHGENLWQLTRLLAFNCQLVREEDGLTLVDTGMAGSGEAILQAVEQLGLPLRRVVLTHAHVDHSGSLDELAQARPDVELLFTARTEAFLRGEMALSPDEPQEPLRGGFEPRAARATRYLEAGDRVGSLRVVAAPGHTPDQIALFDERDGSLLAGDAFQTMAGVAVAGSMRWLFPFPAMATWHKPTALQTALALRELNPARLIVGHGAVLEQPGTAMDKAIRKAKAALNGN